MNLPTVSPTDLSYFIEVAVTLNLSRAAERLGIAQPSLSLAIKRLETEVGTHLFIRHKRGVSLTQAGKQLQAHARQLSQYWLEVKSQALASHNEVQGSFVIGAHPSVILHAIPTFLPALLAKHPKLEVHFEHELSRKITEGVINLSIDLGIVVNPVRHPDLVMQKLTNSKVTFWQAEHLNQAIKDNVTVICDIELNQSQILLKNLLKKGIKYNRMLTSSSLEVIASLTQQGCGIGILPCNVAMSKNLIKINDAPVFQDEIFLIYRHENRHIKALQTIINAIKNVFKEKI